MYNNRALSTLPKLWIVCFIHTVVGEHSSQRRRGIVRYSGAVGKENVGISNVNAGV